MKSIIIQEDYSVLEKGKNVDLELEWAASSYSFVAKKIPSITQGSFILEITEISE